MKFFRKFSGQKGRTQQADRLARSVFDRSVAPVPYQLAWVEDEFEARLNWARLHGVCLIRRLMRGGEDAKAAAHSVTEALMSLFDYALRETGIGDSSIARKVRKQGEQFVGLGKALNEAFEDEATAFVIQAVLTRNEFGYQSIEAVTAYVIRLANHLDTLTDTEILQAQNTLWPEFLID